MTSKMSEDRLYDLILKDLKDKEDIVGVYRQDVTRVLFKLFWDYAVAEAKFFVFGSSMDVDYRQKHHPDAQ